MDRLAQAPALKRRTRSLLGMLVLAGALGAAVFAQLRHEEALAPEPLTRIDAAAVHSLSVSCRGCTTRRFEKRSGHWRMLQPQDAAADDEAVERLVAIANTPIRFRHAAGELDPKKLGLDPPLAILALDGATLKFGTTDAIHGDRYVEVEDDGTIALAPDRFSARLFASPENEIAH